MSINHRILMLVTAATLIVAWPLLYISEEMYQEHITQIVDSTSRETIQQTLLFIEKSPTEGEYLNTIPSPGKSTFIFDTTGSILEGDDSATTRELIAQLQGKLPNEDTASIITTEVTTGHKEPQGWDCSVGFAPKTNTYIAVCYDRDFTYEVSTSMQSTAGILALGVILLSLLGAKLISWRIARPLNQLADYARRLPHRDLAEGNEVNVMSELSTSNDKDINELVQAVDYMETELARHIQNERDAAAERERIQSELRIAAEIQQGALPQNISIPENAASIKARMQPAREVGGDLYDYFMVDDNTLFFTLGDVSGKGVPAALFMFATKHTLRSLVTQDMPLSDVMGELNDTLAANNASAMYVTMVAGRFDLKTGELEYVMAGHQPPIVKRSDGTLAPLEGPTNLPVGNIDGFIFESNTTQLETGDRLITFTDGVTEASNTQNKLYGQERLLSLLLMDEASTCDDMLDAIFASVADFTNGCSIQDDLTALCLHAKKRTSQS